jgi:glycosyltransferase involved in cell wall biosynthesis
LAASYTLSGGGPHELFRDLIVLKAATDTEKGVILLKYARTFSAIAALLDLTRLLERYTLVLEPCWAGYCDTAILLLMSPGQPLLVQCFTADDYRYVESVGAPLIPLRLGPADWVDADIFSVEPVAQKTYDLVMVANWAARKRHALLFRALRDVVDRDVRVLLVGFAWYDRTADDIRREAREYRNDRVHIEIVEKVPQSQLAQYLSQCNAFVFLSRKEGDNKALVEAMFADVPAIVYDKTQGGAGSRINPATGIFSSEQDLTQKIRYMLDNRASFSPRKWAFANTGSAVSTRVLDAALKKAVTASGGLYVESIIEKTNAPNLAYKNAAQRQRFKNDYDFVTACLRFAPKT